MTITHDILRYLEERYNPNLPGRKVPPCGVCGGELQMADTGGPYKNAVYACAGASASVRKASTADERDDAYDHYRRSLWNQPKVHGDPAVMALVKAYREIMRPVRAERDEDYKTEYQERWQPLITTGGQLDEDKIARELADYGWLCRSVSQAYYAVTGGRVSDPRTLPSAVEELIDQRLQEAVSEESGEIASSAVRSELELLLARLVSDAPDESGAIALIRERLEEHE